MWCYVAVLVLGIVIGGGLVIWWLANAIPPRCLW